MVRLGLDLLSGYVFARLPRMICILMGSQILYNLSAVPLGGDG
jgi:hypothetical protein